MMRSMVIEDTLEASESILDGEDLARIREEFNILLSSSLSCYALLRG